jgi:glycosyltransferase involved in cell wall biosynthesis
MVVTIYDLTFETNPEWFSAPARLVLAGQAAVAARTAKRIVTASEHVRTAILERYGTPPERVVVAPLSVDPTFLGTAPPPPHALAGRRYVLALGGAPRRQLPVAIAAWRKVRREDEELSLAVVGEPDGPSEPGLLRLGSLSDADWHGAVAGAVALCYPTLDEGFGMPAAEAAASGTPVVCARVGSLPEVLGDAGAWCASTSADDIADGLRPLVRDDAHRASVGAAGRLRIASLPPWDRTASVLVDAYEGAAHG